MFRFFNAACGQIAKKLTNEVSTVLSNSSVKTSMQKRLTTHKTESSAESANNYYVIEPLGSSKAYMIHENELGPAMTKEAAQLKVSEHYKLLERLDRQAKARSRHYWEKEAEEAHDRKYGKGFSGM